MHAFGRKLFSLLVVVLTLFAAYVAVSFDEQPAADFTFINGTEIESIDPAVVTGQPEGRIIRSIFEGLTNWDPKDLSPTPGVAKEWKVSEDGRTITFFLRDDARWSDGSPVTADDFLYAYRRFLDPITGARYAYQMHYVVGAKKYNLGDSKIGDPVEIELIEPPKGALEFARGEVVRGTLRARDKVIVDESKQIAKIVPYDQSPPKEESKQQAIERRRRTIKRYTVDVDGKTCHFKVGRAENRDLPLAEFQDHEPARQLLVDFSTVGIRVPDPHTLEFKLENKVPYFVKLTGFYPLYPVHRETIERFGYPQWTHPENVVSNGAFRLGSRQIRDRIRLVKNEQYWDAENVYLNTIDALAVESANTGLNMYENRQVDWISTVPTAIVPELIEQERPDFKRAAYLTIAFYRFNVNVKPLGDVRIRRALTLAIDRDRLVKKIIRGGQTPATSFVPPGIAGYDSPTCCEYDPEEARRLLAEAGFPDGDGFPKLTLLYNSSDDLKKIAESIQYNWRDTLGVEIELANQEWGAFLTRVHSMDYDIARAGWIGDYVDPNTFLDMFVTDGGNNETGWSNEEYDDLILNRIPAEDDDEKRMQLLRQAEEILLREMPIIPLYYGISSAMVRPYVKGYHNNILNVHPLKDISVDQEEKARFLSRDDRSRGEGEGR